MYLGVPSSMTVIISESFMFSKVIWNKIFEEIGCSPNLRFHFKSCVGIIICLKVWFVEFMVSPVYQKALYCSNCVSQFPLLRIKLLFPNHWCPSHSKTKGSCGQIRFSLWYPTSIDEYVMTSFLLHFPMNQMFLHSIYLS